MKNFVGVLIAALIVVIATDAVFAVPVKYNIPIPVTGFLVAILSFTLILSTIFLRLPFDSSTHLSVTIETTSALAIFLLPIFVGVAWIDYAPEHLVQLIGFELFLLLSVPLFFQLALYGMQGGWTIFATRAALVVYVASVIFDVLFPESGFAIWKQRPSGFISNPNEAAAQIDLLLILVLPWSKPRNTGYLWMLVALVGVILTFSRSGLGLWGLVFGLYVYKALRSGSAVTRVGTISLSSILAVAIASVAALPYLLPKDKDFQVEFNVDRILQLTSLLQGETAQIGQDQRVKLLIYYTREVMQEPLVGKGSMYSMSGHGAWSGGIQSDEGPHNMYVTRLLDEGVLGLLGLLGYFGFWITFFFAHRSQDGIIAMIALGYLGFFSHNHDQYIFILAIPYLAAAKAIVNSADGRPLAGLTIGARPATSVSWEGLRALFAVPR